MNLVSIEFHSTNTNCRYSPVDCNVKDLAADKRTDIPADKADENFIAGKVVRSVKLGQHRESR